MSNIFDLPPEEAEMPFSILDTDLYKVNTGWEATDLSLPCKTQFSSISQMHKWSSSSPTELRKCASQRSASTQSRNVLIVS